MITFEVKDLTCGHCVSAIAKAVKQVDAAAQVSVDLLTKRVEINSSVADGVGFEAAIQEAGYSPKPATAASFAATQGATSGCCCGHLGGWLD